MPDPVTESTSLALLPTETEQATLEADELLFRVANGSLKCKTLEQAYAINPAPELELILKLTRMLIFELATGNRPQPEYLRLVDQMTHTVAACAIGQARVGLKDREVKLAEIKAAGEQQSSWEKALQYCLKETRKYPEVRQLFQQAFAALKAKMTPPEITAGIAAAIGVELMGKRTNAPVCASFKEFLTLHARVADRSGAGTPFSMTGRAPLELIADWIDKILRNTLDGEIVEIDGVTFAPGKLKGASLAVGGGAQFGKTIIELNLMAYATAIRFLSVGNYLPDRPKVEEIVGQKFRPNVLDLYPWMAEMIQIGKIENASGKTMDRKESYTVTDGTRKSFGSFCGMHKPPTSITIDIALLDEVDDIPDRNIGYVDGRMTNSPVHLTCFIGTQRIAGAGQNARLARSSFHVKWFRCPGCGQEWNLEENFPRCLRVPRNLDGRSPSTTGGSPVPLDPILTAETGYDRNANYYCACPECGHVLDRDGGRYAAKHPARIAEAKLGVRVSQLNISAISLPEIVAAWFAAMTDPSGEAMQAFYCDRIGIPNAGAAQPITQNVLDRCRGLGSGTRESPQRYRMSSVPGGARFAGLDTGPRCWFWCDELSGDAVSRLIWAEMMGSLAAFTRVSQLMKDLAIACLFLDAGGEPDLTKRLVLALNGLADLPVPERPHAELLRSKMSNFGHGLSWDGERGCWSGLKAAAVLFVAGEAKGIQQTIGFTQEGKMYPLIKCHRGESIQTAVNDFLTPSEGVLEMVGPPGKPALRSLPRARLPEDYQGVGVTQTVLDGHLLNLRKARDVKTGHEDWADGVENHLGLAKVYARLAVMAGNRRAQPVAFSKSTGPTRQSNPGTLGLGQLKTPAT